MEQLADDVSIRRLGTDDALQLRQLRLFGLKESPTAFTESYEELAGLDQQDYVKAIQDAAYFGAFVGSELIAMMGYFIRPHHKQCHQGVLFGVYVHPDRRGQGISGRLIRILLEDARQHVEMMILQVAINNFSARHTYLNAGFQSYGVEPRALKVDGDYIDEEMMWLDLVKGTHKIPPSTC